MGHTSNTVLKTHKIFFSKLFYLKEKRIAPCFIFHGYLN